MNMADYAIFIFWLVCLIRGVFRGPMNELFSITGVLGGLFVAAYSYATISKILPGWLGSVPLRYLICFIIPFCIVYSLVSVFGIITSYLFYPRRTGWLNRAFGSGFGALKGVLVISVLFVPMVAFFPRNLTWIKESSILPYTDLLSEKIVQITPPPIHDPFASHMDGYKQSWHRN